MDTMNNDIELKNPQKSSKYGHMIFDKETRNTYWKKKASSTHSFYQAEWSFVEESKQVHT